MTSPALYFWAVKIITLALKYLSKLLRFLLVDGNKKKGLATASSTFHLSLSCHARFLAARLSQALLAQRSLRYGDKVRIHSFFMPYNGKQVTDTVNKELFTVVLHREFSTEAKKIHTFNAVLSALMQMSPACFGALWQGVHRHRLFPWLKES